VTTRRKRLAKDLDLLIGAVKKTPSDVPNSSSTQTGGALSPQKDGLRRIPLEKLQRGQYQPRREFDSDALAQLAKSIKAEGIIQPIVVRPVSEDRWEIIAGERRWRASQIAGLADIPALVRDVSDESTIAMALIENIQRQDLNAIEEAQAVKRLQVEFELSQQQMAERLGRSRPAIANLLRLLNLENDVQAYLQKGDLEVGHAKALLALEGGEQLHAAHQVVQRGLTVRQTEQLVKQIQEPQKAPQAPKDADIQRLEQNLSARLGAAVTISHKATGAGKLTVGYHSLDELDGILARIR